MGRTCWRHRWQYYPHRQHACRMGRQPQSVGQFPYPWLHHPGCHGFCHSHDDRCVHPDSGVHRSASGHPDRQAAHHRGGSRSAVRHSQSDDPGCPGHPVFVGCRHNQLGYQPVLCHSPWCYLHRFGGHPHRSSGLGCAKHSLDRHQQQPVGQCFPGRVDHYRHRYRYHHDDHHQHRHSGLDGHRYSDHQASDHWRSGRAAVHLHQPVHGQPLDPVFGRQPHRPGSCKQHHDTDRRQSHPHRSSGLDYIFLRRHRCPAGDVRPTGLQLHVPRNPGHPVRADRHSGPDQQDRSTGCGCGRYAAVEADRRDQHDPGDHRGAGVRRWQLLPHPRPPTCAMSSTWKCSSRSPAPTP